MRSSTRRAVGTPARPSGQESRRGTPDKASAPGACLQGEGTGREQQPARGSGASAGLEAGVFMGQFLGPVQCPEGSWAGQLWQKQMEAPLWGWLCPLWVPSARQRAGLGDHS